MKHNVVRRTLAVVTSALLGVSVAVTATQPAFAVPDERLVAHYTLDETSGAVAADLSGNGRDATIVGGPTLTGGEGVRLDGVDDHVRLPNNILAGLTSITVSTEVLIRTTQSTPYFIYGMGNTSSGTGNGYLFSTGNAYRSSIASGNWSTEQTVNSGANLARGVWKTITYTLDDPSNTARIYLDGVQVAQNTNVTITPGSIGNGVTAANYLGRSVYTADRYLAGSLRDFRIYDVALTAQEVAALQPADQVKVDRDLAVLDLGDLSAVQGNLTLPTSGPNGAAIAWASSDPEAVSASGVVTRPAASDGDASVTLTATVTRGGATGTKQFEATVIAEEDDQAIVDAAAAALVITNVGDVRGNLTLPGAPAGTQVAWASPAPATIATDGVVVRPDSDTDVTLTATVTRNGATATREFVATVRAAVALEPFEGYAFSYFTGNSIAGENIYFAASNGNNALDWTELNGGQPTLTSKYGTKGLRDPFIIRSPEGDTFYLIATDLSIGSGTSWDASQRQGSLHLEVWESHDLVNWSEQRHVKVSPDTAGNTWAPEAYYDESIGAFVVFWASKLYAENDPGHTGSTYNRMLYATTRDFVTFSEPQIWQDGMSRIDSTVIKDGDTYHRFTKDEGAGSTGCSDIIQETSTELRAPLTSWTMIDSCIGRDAGTSAVEGPTVFHSNPGDVNGDKTYLFVDEFGGRGYIPLETADIATPDWKVAANYDLPASPRHGTVLPVTAAELERLTAGPPPVEANEDGEILRYDFTDAAGTVVTDRSGNGHDGTIVGGAAWQGDALTFDGTDDYVDLPDHLLTGVQDVTVEAEVKISPSQSGSYFLYGFGNTDASGVGQGYLFTTGNSAYRTGIASGNWTTEQNVSSGSALPRDKWVHLTYTLEGTTARLYLDGVEVARNTGVTLDPGDLGGGSTLANYLGRSLYNADPRFRGQFREFALYNRALSPGEVLTRSGNTGALAGVTLADPSQLKVAPIVDAAARTVVFPVVPGTDVAALTPVFDTADGVTASPASGDTVDLGEPLVVTLTAPDGSTATWTMQARVMASPVLPGHYADPNIAVFGDTYYIYATTDGFAGWGGKEFYVWKSKDLVEWERSAEPILTLDGANGDVPWATGNAWAPTVIERDGKFYFYFSGHNAALNRKTIGVAVADHPEGPFVAQPTAMITNGEAVKSGQAIDPAAFHDPVTGKHYLFWGNGSPLYAELNDDMVSIKPETIKAISGLTSFREGSFVNYRDGLYHLTYSIDDTGSENYRVGYATATSIDGPWTSRGVILQKDTSLGIRGTGHSSVINVPGTDDWYIAYHRFAMPDGNGTHRETTIDRIEFDENGLMKTVTPTLESVDPQTVVDPEPLGVAISGQAEVGQTLTAAVADPWTASAFQWTRDGEDIADATGVEYVLTSADLDATIGVTVTAGKPLWSPSTESAEVGPVRPAPSVPARPDAPRVTAGPASITVRWEAPDDGGRAISGYTITLTPRGTDQPTLVREVGGTSVTVTFTGLQPGAKYRATIVAHNEIGSSPVSAPSSEVLVRKK
ncbi:family 43 glycosylhydrolase [Agromyces sp. ISL-38]|uniref:family 43 glycosylhydrolase n=1 Tax=Agromyces sp. ISL-38 TaxID=2819107 RepID=UPI001BEB7F86|nr:family 43 glycosylhydrolase [Agromyces sp. ISL-38]MBT2499326.1 family 43 glycosylhydrolase [Agromyces sp. ISL-38]